MNKVLMVIDETAASRAALSVYAAMARQPEHVVLVLVRTFIRGKTPGQRTERLLDSYKRELETCGSVRVKTLVREGMPSEEILKAAGDERVDLIIIGGRGGFWSRRFVSERVIKKVEQGAHVPVVVARTARCEKSTTVGWRGEYAA